MPRISTWEEASCLRVVITAQSNKSKCNSSRLVITRRHKIKYVQGYSTQSRSWKCSTDFISPNKMQCFTFGNQLPTTRNCSFLMLNVDITL